MSTPRDPSSRSELVTVIALGVTLSLSLFFFLAGRGLGERERSRQSDGQRAGAAAAPDFTGTVSGHIEEVNTGSFDLVDGVAYRSGADVVVFVTSKPIASAALAGSTCPMTLARSLALLRNASWAEVTLDKDGDSPYFAYGTQYEGQSRADDPAGNYVSTALDVEDGRAEGGARHRDYGKFTFDLPLLAPALPEPSQRDRYDNRIWPDTPPLPTAADAIAAYQMLRRAALAKNLDALLTAQGFTTPQLAAVRALPGIEADLAAHADRFLTPRDLSPEDEVRLHPSHAHLAATGET